MPRKSKRTELKEVLAKLPDGSVHIFKRMYSPTDLTKDINLVVDEIPNKKLKWALTQCYNSYYSLFQKLKADYNN